MRDAKPPKGPGWGVVGVHSVAVNLGVGHLVGASGVGGGAFEHFGGKTGVGSSVADQLGLHGCQRTVPLGPGLDADDGGVSLGVRQQRFAPVVEDLDRPASGLGQQGGVDLPHDVLFAAKAAPDEGTDHPYLLLT